MLTSTDLTVGSLFAGVGGFDIAAERAGMEVLWQSENDKAASRVLEHRWPGLNLGDIHDVTIETDDLQTGVRRVDTRDSAGVDDGRRIGRRIANTDSVVDGGQDDERAPAVDVLCGGFPCQDYSVAGNREGLAGDRGALWWEYHRLIAEGRPTWVVAENVPGLLSSRGGQDFATIIDSLTEYGYGVVWGVLDAQWFGVAQRRRRVFIVGHSSGIPRPEILALAESMSGHPEPSRETGQDVAGTLETRPTDSRYRVKPGHLIPFTMQSISEYADLDVASTVMQRDHKSPTDLIAFTQNQRDEVRDLNDLSGALAAEPGMKQQTYVMRQREGKPGGGKGPLLSPNVRLTLAANTNDQTLFVGPTVRRLTPLECERLQGFPDGWTDTPGNADSQRYRQMGNAVAVPVVEWIMRRIAEC